MSGIRGGPSSPRWDRDQETKGEPVGIYYSVFGSTCLPNHSYIAVYFPLVLLQ